MPTKYQFGGLGHLFVCPCGCSEFIRAEGVKPERIEVYECANCHEWYTPNTDSMHPTSGIVRPSKRFYARRFTRSRSFISARHLRVMQAVRRLKVKNV